MVKNKKPRITIVGSYAVGMTMTTEKFPVPGETVIGYNFQVEHGGKGSNQAVAIARLGGEAIFIGCVGDDYYGIKALELYQQEGVNASFVRKVKESPTGVGFIIVNTQGNNVIVIDPGANNKLSPEDIDKAEKTIAESDAILMQLEISPVIVEYTAKIAQKHNIPVFLNPAPYQPLSDEVLKLVEVLIPNETEAKLLAGFSPQEEISYEEVAEKLLKKGVKQVVMTLGEQGVLLVTSEKSAIIKAKKVEVVDTTGAGDTFSAAFTLAVAEGKDVESAIEFGVKAAALAVTKYGVIPSLPTREEVETFFAE